MELNGVVVFLVIVLSALAEFPPAAFPAASVRVASTGLAASTLAAYCCTAPYASRLGNLTLMQDCFAFGGLTTESNPSRSLFRITLQRTGNSFILDGGKGFTQLSLPQGPSPRSASALNAISVTESARHLFLFGGVDESGSVTNGMFSLDVSSSDQILLAVWHEVDTNSVLLPVRARHSMLTSTISSTNKAEALLLFGVGDQGPQNSVWQVQLELLSTDKWVATGASEMILSDGSPIPAPRYGSSCVGAVGLSEVVCFGGVDGDHNILAELWLLNRTDASSSPTWSAQYNANAVGRCDAQSASYTDSFGSVVAYFIGGLTFDSNNALIPLDEKAVMLWKYNFSSHVFSSIGATVAGLQQRVLRGGGLLAVGPQAVVLLLAGGTGASGPTGDVQVVSTDDQSTRTVQASTVFPDGRAFHCAAPLGGGASVIGFGIQGDRLLTSVYVFVPRANGGSSWIVVNTSASIVSPGGRFGLSCVAQSQLIYFHGGFLSPAKGSSLSNELWALRFDPFAALTATTVTASWTLVDSTGSKRALHQAFMYNTMFVVIGGSVGSDDAGPSGDAEVFDLRKQLWNPIVIRGATFTPRKGFHLFFNGIFAYAHGGLGVGNGVPTVMSDVIRFTVPTRKNWTNLLVMNTVAVYGPTSAAGRRPVAAAFGCSAGSSDSMLICGGINRAAGMLWLGQSASQVCQWISFTDPARPIQVFNRTLNAPSGEAVTSSYGCSMVWVKDSLTLFGGVPFVGTTALKLLDASRILTQVKLPSSSLCNSSDAGGNTSCYSCGQGSVKYINATDCAVTPPGAFLRSGAAVAEQCAAGYFSWLPGASTVTACEPCPNGTYSSSVGSAVCLPCRNNSVCFVGSYSDNQSTTGAPQSTSLQPERLEDGTVPIVIFIIAGCVALFLLLLVIQCALVGKSARTSRRNAYFSAGDLQKLRSLFDRSSKGNSKVRKDPGGGDESHADGMPFRKFLKNVVRGEWFLSPEEITDEFVANAFQEYDGKGLGTLRFSEFLDLVIMFADSGILPQVKDTNETYQTSTCCGEWLLRFRLKGFDLYDRDHTLEKPGEAVKLRTTSLGGALSLAFYIVAVGAIIVLVGQFVYQNVSEKRMLISGVELDSVGVTAASLTIEATIFGPFGASSCVDLKGGCIAETVAGLQPAPETGDMSMPSCRFDAAAGSCTIALSCTDCVLPLDSVVEGYFVFGGNSFANNALIRVSSSTGIAPGASLDSQVTEAVVPTDISQVLRGFPATFVNVFYLPTRVTTVNDVVRQAQSTATGAHVRYTSTQLGNQVRSDRVHLFYGVPITVRLGVDSNLLDITRLPSSSPIDFASQVLGAVSGIAGVFVVVMQLAEGFLVDHSEDSDGRKPIALRDVKGLTSSESSDDEVSTSTTSGAVEREKWSPRRYVTTDARPSPFAAPPLPKVRSGILLKEVSEEICM